VPTIFTLKSSTSDDDLFFLVQIRGLKGTEVFPSHKTLEGQCLRFPPFFGSSLLVNIQGDPAIDMPEEFLGGLDLDTILPEQVGESMAEGMPTCSILCWTQRIDAKTF
jgi:hypothetical protein